MRKNYSTWAILGQVARGVEATCDMSGGMGAIVLAKGRVDASLYMKGQNRKEKTVCDGDQKVLAHAGIGKKVENGRKITGPRKLGVNKTTVPIKPHKERQTKQKLKNTQNCKERG